MEAYGFASQGEVTASNEGLRFTFGPGLPFSTILGIFTIFTVKLNFEYVSTWGRYSIAGYQVA